MVPTELVLEVVASRRHNLGDRVLKAIGALPDEQHAVVAHRHRWETKYRGAEADPVQVRQVQQLQGDVLGDLERQRWKGLGLGGYEYPFPIVEKPALHFHSVRDAAVHDVHQLPQLDRRRLRILDGRRLHNVVGLHHVELLGAEKSKG